MRHRRTITLDLRERRLDAYDEGEAALEQVVHQFRVSLGMLKKLIQQRLERDLPFPFPTRAPEEDRQKKNDKQKQNRTQRNAGLEPATPEDIQRSKDEISKLELQELDLQALLSETPPRPADL